MPARILIADDHQLLADAVASMLNAQSEYAATTTDSLDGAMARLAEEGGFDLVMLDLRMPGMVGLASVKSVIEKAADGKVVLFSGMVDRHFLDSALEIGCRGLIPKTMPLQALSNVIQLILLGQVFVPNSVLQPSTQTGSGSELTEAELFVLRLAADGMTNKEVARDMNTSEVTVKMHMRSICKKLGARNRAHAATISRERLLI